MRRIRRRKVLYGSMLSLIILMSFSLSCLKSFAAISQYDAAEIFNTQVPSYNYNWWAFGNTQNYHKETYAVSQIQSSTNNFLWRQSISLETSTNSDVLRFLTYYEYDDDLRFYDGYVYSFSIRLRFGNTGGNLQELGFDPMSFTIAFPSGSFDPYTADNFTNAALASYFPIAFKPSSYTWNGVYCNLKFNIPVVPDTAFSDYMSNLDSITGKTYRAVPGFAIFLQSAVAAFRTQTQNHTYLFAFTIYPWSPGYVNGGSFASVYTPEEYSAMVVQQGFDELSQQVSLQTNEITSAIEDQTDEIVGSIEQGVDDILNAGDPFDTSDFDDFHNVETQIGQNLMSTHPFSAASTGRVFNLPAVNHVVAAMSSMSDWYTYLYDYNTLAYTVIFFSLAAHLIYLTFKFLI